MPHEGFDVSSTSRLAAIDRNNLDFPVEPTREQPAMGGRKVDLDLGGGIEVPGAVTEELAVPDLEPVTLSEVGTKLDLARAYVDMGDPDGARNILNEVQSEGSASQKQEAQRLLESLPGWARPRLDGTSCPRPGVRRPRLFGLADPARPQHRPGRGATRAGTCRG